MIATHEEQVERWVRGELDGKGEEAHAKGDCCPDFACCNLTSRATDEERQRFATAEPNGRERELLLGLFLGRAIASLGGPRAYISNGDAPWEEESKNA